MSNSNRPIADPSAQPSIGEGVMIRAWFLNVRSAWVVLLLSLSLTLFVWKATDENLVQARQAQFEFRVAEVSEAVRNRMGVYEQVLRGTLGLFAASANVSRAEFKEYVASLKIEEQYPGIRGLGFAVHIPARHLDAHLSTIRAEGFPDYAIRPPGARAEYVPVIYLEPFDLRNQRAFGFDMFSEATRRAAMEHARDTGETSMSAKVTLAQETSQGIQAGMLMYLPFYKNGAPHNTLAERRANLVGYVYGAFRLNDFMSGILGTQPTGAEPDIDIEVYDGTVRTADSLLYDDDRIPHALGTPPPGRLTLTRTMDSHGHTWSLYFTTRSAFHAAFGSNEPLLILLIGTVLSVMLSGLIWIFATQRRRALKLASDLTSDLRGSEHRVQAMLDNVQEGILTISETGMIELLNPAVERLFGYRNEEVIGKNISILMPEPYQSEHDGYLVNYLRTGQAKIIGIGREVTGRRSDGSVFPMDLAVSEFFLGGASQVHRQRP